MVKNILIEEKICIYIIQDKIREIKFVSFTCTIKRIHILQEVYYIIARNVKQDTLRMCKFYNFKQI